MRILEPSPRHVIPLALIGAGCLAIGASLWGTSASPRPAAPRRAAPAPVVAVIPGVPPRPAPAPAPAPVADPAPAPRAPASRAHEVQLVFRVAGDSYVQLAELASPADRDEDGDEPRARAPIPAHGAVHLVDDHGLEQAIAAIRPGDVPPAYRGWLGRAVVIDGTCRAHVVGLAVVWRLTGDPAYAGLDGQHWTKADVLAQGTAKLAARLDRCTGTYARDAALPGVIVPVAAHAAQLAAKARARLIASPVSAKVQREWRADGGTGRWEAQTRLLTQIVRDPATGVLWISIQGDSDGECGAADTRAWGLFRAGADGALETVALRRLDAIWKIDQLVDIDGDGVPELVGKDWLGLDTVIETAGGDELARLDVPFYGCGC